MKKIIMQMNAVQLVMHTLANTWESDLNRNCMHLFIFFLPFGYFQFLSGAIATKVTLPYFFVITSANSEAFRGRGTPPTKTALRGSIGLEVFTER